MKKLNYFIIGAMGLVLLSCSTDEIYSPSSGEDAIITLDLNVPHIQSRAYSDGTKAQNLQIVIYENIEDQTKYVESLDLITDFYKSRSVKIHLLKDHSYSVGIWASSEDAKDIYTINWETDDPILSIDYSKVIKANDENLDAFYAFEKIGEATGDATISVKLKRPFAQINVGTSDLSLASEKGYTVKNSSISVKDGYDKFSFKTGDITDDAKSSEVNFDINSIPEKGEDYLSFPVEGYDYLAMAYVLVPKDQENAEITFKYSGEYSDNRNDIDHSRTITEVPVKQNHRTNIFGRVLTTQDDLEVEIDDRYDGDENVADLVEVYNGVTLDTTTQTFFIDKKEGLKWIADIVNTVTTDVNVESQTYQYGGANVAFAGQTIRLTSDIDLQGEEWTPIGCATKDNGASIYAFAGTFDGAGYTISNLKISQLTDNSNAGLFGATNRAIIKNVTLKNIDIQSHYKTGAIVGDGYNAKIENCKVLGGRIISTPWNNNGKIDDANNVGGIAGYLYGQPETAYAKNCVVDGLTISAFRKVGGIAGVAGAADDKPAGQETKYVEISACKVMNTSIIADMTNSEYDGYASKVPDIGKIYGIKSVDEGDIDSFVKIFNNTAGDDVTTEVKVAESAKLKDIISNLSKSESSEISLTLPTGSVDMKESTTGEISFPENKTIILTGTGATQTTIANFDYSTSEGSTFIFKDLTLKVFENPTNHTAMGIKKAIASSFENVDLYGEYHVFSGNATFKKCNFKFGGGGKDQTRYGLYMETNGDVLLEDCVFDTSCEEDNLRETKGILVYAAGDGSAYHNKGGNLTLKNCEFQVTGRASTKAAVEIHTENFTSGGTINISNTKYTPGGYISLWREIGAGSAPTTLYNINVDGNSEQIAK